MTCVDRSGVILKLKKGVVLRCIPIYHYPEAHSQSLIKAMEVSTSGKKSQDDASSLQSHSLSNPASSHTSCADSHHELEKAFEPLSQHASRATGPPLSRHATTIASTWSREPDFEVDWDENDPANPVNWSTWYKGATIFSVAWSTFVVVVYSTSYTSGLRPMMTDFHVDSEPVVTLGVTTYRWFPPFISISFQVNNC